MFCLQKAPQNLAVKTGAIPSSLHVPMVCLSGNMLAGSIPERLLGGRAWTREYIVANALEVLAVTHSHYRA
eukprot:23407-Amphidinium_carterae.1